MRTVISVFSEGSTSRKIQLCRKKVRIFFHVLLSSLSPSHVLPVELAVSALYPIKVPKLGEDQIDYTAVIELMIKKARNKTSNVT